MKDFFDFKKPLLLGQKKSRKVFSWLILLIIFLLIWGGRFYLELEGKKEGNEPIVLEGFIWEKPKTFYSSQTFWVKNYQIETLVDYKLEVGDKLALVGKPECQLINKFQKKCLISYPEISVKKGSFWSKIIRSAARLREKLITSLEQVLPSEPASLLTGLVWGNQGQFSQKFYQDMKASGLLHVVVASGANVMSLVNLLKKGRSFLGRRLSILAALPIIVLYGFIVGNDPPIIRAVLMSILVLFSSLFGRQINSLRGLFLAAAIMMVFDPLLFADISFQLSFGASLGILLFSKKLEKVFRWSDLATTLAAQVITVPILTLYFGQLSPLSFLSNAFLLWLIEPLMIWGLLLTFLGLISRFLASLIGLFFWLPLQIFIWGGEFWARILPNISVSSRTAILSFFLVPLLGLALFFVKEDE
ncbi:MAG: DNA internalization-related competence protein ComEC/Rec2 [Microgenomates bacterium 39_7]|nr:MAG: DNA internalization-related competence protein ComEC/Rec2 [Microgenomates bacterium 39_7]